MSSIAETLTLYHAPIGYYGYRVLIALEEKQLAHVTHNVAIIDGETMEPWFMKINPRGQLPAMVHGSSNIPGSQEIMEYLESAFPDAPVKLYPEAGSVEMQRLKKFLTADDKFAIAVFVCGSYNFPELVPRFGICDRSVCKLIQYAGFESIPKKAREYGKLYPDMKDMYDKKEDNLPIYNPTLQAFKDNLEQLRSLIDYAEAELQETAKSGGAYFIGDSLTAGDICLAVLLKKIGIVGYSSFWQNGQYPLLEAYWKRIQERPSFKKVFDVYEEDINATRRFISEQESSTPDQK